MAAQSPSIRGNLKAAPLIGKVGKTIAGAYRRGRRVFRDWWSQGIRYPVLIDTRKTWIAYQEGLPKKGLYELRTSSRLNLDCRYEEISNFDPQQIRRFMEIWERHYKLPPEFFEELEQTHNKGWLRGWTAHLGGEPVAIHFIEQYGRYALGLPPFYDKTALRSRSLGTYMWFQLIQRAISDTSLDFLDLGGGPVAQLAPDSYKRRYNPEDLGYRVKTCLHCGYMWPFLKLKEVIQCKHCGRSITIWRQAARMKFRRDEW